VILSASMRAREHTSILAEARSLKGRVAADILPHRRRKYQKRLLNNQPSLPGSESKQLVGEPLYSPHLPFGDNARSQKVACYEETTKTKLGLWSTIDAPGVIP
jgi:hypothetical protein